MNWKKKFMWAASFLVSLFVCGTALAAGNDASADTPKIRFTGSVPKIMSMI